MATLSLPYFIQHKKVISSQPAQRKHNWKILFLGQIDKGYSLDKV